MSDKQYLSYDLKGIQSFIFKVPKLKAVIGGSLFISDFDEDVRKIIPSDDIIYTGGGKGTILTGDIDVCRKKLIDLAQKYCLNIALTNNFNYFQTHKMNPESYSYISGLDGKPCNISGLYPTKNSNGTSDEVQKRLKRANEKWTFEFNALQDFGGKKFFKNVEDNEDDEGKSGFKALGSRNRWAIICMDGNDIGKQLRALEKKSIDEKWTRDYLHNFLRNFSKNLDDCTKAATKRAIKDIAEKWLENKENDKCEVLPIRPLVVGGDDVTVICHVKYAFDLAKKIIEYFNEESKKNGIKDSWIGTNCKELTISAGILFCNVGLPLHMAIPYAEEILKLAKSIGKKDNNKRPSGAPEPAIDWEILTDSVIDTPSKKRQRDFIFLDNGIERKLTAKPYLLLDFEKLQNEIGKHDDTPRNIRHQFLPNLSKPHNDRLAFCAMLRKNYPEIYENMFEELDSKKEWEYIPRLLDGFSLLEEEQR